MIKYTTEEIGEVFHVDLSKEKINTILQATDKEKEEQLKPYYKAKYDFSKNIEWKNTKTEQPDKQASKDEIEPWMP